MIPILYNGESLYLFNHAPDWTRSVETEFMVPSERHAGLTNIEARPSLGEGLRVPTYRFSFVAEGKEAIALRNALQAHTTERLAVPFWPGALPHEDFLSSPMPGGLKITFELDGAQWPDFSQAEIHTGREPSGSYTVTEHTWTAPLLIARFFSPLDPVLGSDEVIEDEVVFEEDSGIEQQLLIDAQSFAVGPSLGGLTPRLFPLRHDFARRGHAGGAVTDVDVQTYGQGRQSSRLHHGAAPARTQRQGISFGSLEEAAQLLRFFVDRRALAQAFWLPTQLAETRLTQSVTAGEQALHVEDATALGTHRYIALQDRERVVPVHVSSISSNTLHLASPLDYWEAEETSVCALVLARFAKRRISVSWSSGGTGAVDLEFLELPPEYSSIAGEVVGSTVGATGARAALYTFTDIAGNITRLTSYERRLFDDPDWWETAPLTHGEIEQTLTLEDRTSLRGEAVAGSPLLDFWRRSIRRLFIQIESCKVTGWVISDRRVLFKGELESPKAHGMRIEAEAVAIGRDFDQLVPRGKVQYPCNYGLFSAGCGLLAANWTFEGTITDVGTVGWPYSFTIGSFTRKNGGELPDGFGAASWFAWGVFMLGAQRRAIQNSSAIAGGAITVTLARDLEPFPEVGATVTMRPGCSGYPGVCAGKFDNFPNWGGHFVAPGNLSLVKVESTTGGGKK